MLRRRAKFSSGLLRLIGQIGASVAATAAASMIYAALPRFMPPMPPAPPELTSGGKFAARVPGAEDALTVVTAEQARPAEAGQPLEAVAFVRSAAAAPRLLLPTVADIALPTALTEPASLDAPATAEPARQPPRPAHSAVHAVRHDDEAAAGAPHRAMVAAAPAAQPGSGLPGADVPAAAPIGKPDDGMMPRIMASAQSLVSFTAQAGGAMLSRLVPH